MRVRLQVADADWGCQTGITLYWATNLLVRMGHDVSWSTPPSALEIPGLPRPNLAQSLDFVRQAFTPTAHGQPITIAISRTSQPGTLSVWSDGWTVWVNQDATVDWHDQNAVSAAAAGGLAAAVVRAAEHAHVLAPFSFNLRTFEATPQRGRIDRDLKIAPAILAGAGAVGSAYGLILAHLQPSASLAIVDNQALDGGNVIRYVTAFPCDEGQEKAGSLARLLQDAGVSADGRFADVLEATSRGVTLVVCALDTADDRRQLACNLPAKVLDAAVGEGLVRAWSATLELSVASFPPAGPCLACFYHEPPVQGIPPRAIAGFCGGDVAAPQGEPDTTPRRIFGPAIAGALLAALHIHASREEVRDGLAFRWDAAYPPSADHMATLRSRPDCVVCARPEFQREHRRLWNLPDHPSRSGGE